jgi:uncharacterized SAM-binding protein YcdF (DUF218 family)
VITKFIEPWILFPGNIVLFLAVVAIVLGRARHAISQRMLPEDRAEAARPLGAVRLLGRLLWAAAAILFIISTPAFADRVAGAYERAVAPAPPGRLVQAEAVVALGGGVRWPSPSERRLHQLTEARPPVEQHATGARRPGPSERRLSDETHGADPPPRLPGLPHGRVRSPAALSAEAESRLLYAVRLATELGVPLVVTGGRVLSANVVPPEAEVAAGLARRLSTGELVVHVESRSRTTAENAARTAELVPYRTVAVVTSAYHMRRALLAFRRSGFTPLPAPAPYKSDRRPLRPVMFLPSLHGFELSATVFRELVGLAWYFVRV